jgi:hypothetical protein
MPAARPSTAAIERSVRLRFSFPQTTPKGKKETGLCVALARPSPDMAFEAELCLEDYEPSTRSILQVRQS